jgi:hypothetical protein
MSRLSLARVLGHGVRVRLHDCESTAATHEITLAEKLCLTQEPRLHATTHVSTRTHQQKPPRFLPITLRRLADPGFDGLPQARGRAQMMVLFVFTHQRLH